MLRVPEHIEFLEPYQPGWVARSNADEPRSGDGEIYLASNENPLGCSPSAIAEIRSCQVINRYPASGLLIRKKLAEFLDLSLRNITVGNGSDSIIGTLLRTFAANGDEVLTIASTFPSFAIQAKVQGLAVRTVPYRDWSIDLAAIANAISPATKIVYLPNPNNPTGSMFTDDEFRAFHNRLPNNVLVVLDQAYYEYAVEEPGYPDLPYLEYQNVITLRTFSKAYGLAGLRLGYGISVPRVTEQLLRTQLPFETNCVAEAAAVAALDDQEFVRMVVSTNQVNRALTLGRLREMGYTALPSAANFIMLVMATPSEAGLMVTELQGRNIVVRPLTSFGLPHCIRVTIGTQRQMDLFLREMDALRALRPETSTMEIKEKGSETHGNPCESTR